MMSHRSIVHWGRVLLVTLVLGAPLLVSPPPVHAFGLATHKRILQDALHGQMSAQALGWVIGYYRLVVGAGNLGSDVHLLTPARHFANAPSPTVLCQRWRDGLHHFMDEAVMESAPAGDGLRTLPHRKDALAVFGEATHSLADFYAHTNWIELAVARHVRPGLAPLLGDRCDPRAFPAALQSGYSSHLKGGLISGCPRQGPPPPFRYCDAQLNKDDDTPGHHGHETALADGTTYFQEAVRLATQATAGLWQTLRQRIVARYRTDPTIDGACVVHKLAWGGDASCARPTPRAASAAGRMVERRSGPVLSISPWQKEAE